MTVDATALASVVPMGPTERPQDARQAAEQVEAMFVKMLLKEVRKASPDDGLMNSQEMQTFHDMFDDQIATEIAQSGQLGLADSIEEAITGRPIASHERAHRAYRGHASIDVHGGPVKGRVTSGFGVRNHPILHRRKMHYGVDIGAPTGTPIRAARAGVVTRAENMGTYGNVVFVDHGNGVETRYAHASELLVKPGARVQQGQILATVGSTGRSTGPHLHFEVRKDGIAVDPSGYLDDSPEIHPQSATVLDR